MLTVKVILTDFLAHSYREAQSLFALLCQRLEQFQARLLVVCIRQWLHRRIVVPQK